MKNLIPDSEALVVAVLGCLAVCKVCPDHALAAGASLHLAGVAVHITIAAAHGPIPLRRDAVAGAVLGDGLLRGVGAAAVVGELHPLLAVLDHEVAEVDVGPPVIAAHQVWRLVAVMIAVCQT